MVISAQLRQFLGPELLPLLEDGAKLLESASSAVNSTLPAGRQVYSDYSFVVFPFAKVYEGFLKKLFLEIGAISEQQYNNDRWRVGRALNPQLEKELRHTESVYDRIAERAGEPLANEMWQAWKKGRNQIFHFWPGRSAPLTFLQAQEIVDEIKLIMEKGLRGCKINL